MTGHAAISTLVFLACATGAAAQADDCCLHAREYQVVDSESKRYLTAERTYGHWYITTDAGTFEEFAETAIHAAVDLHERYDTDCTYVTIVADPYIGRMITYGFAAYAADCKGALGLSGADQKNKWSWRVRAAERRATEQEIAIARLWYDCAPDFPSRSLLSSTLVDVEALRMHIAAELGIESNEVEVPRLPMRWCRPSNW